MKKGIFLIFGMLILNACSKDDDNPDESSVIIEDFIYFENASISEEENSREIKIIEGDSLVFYYQYYDENDPAIADDEDVYNLAFQVSPDAENFKLETGDFEDAKALYALLCFCDPNGYFSVSDGIIEGKKVSNDQWEIDVDVSITVPQGEEDTREILLDFDGVFELNPLNN